MEVKKRPKKFTIFSLDDDPDFNFLLSKMLEPSGINLKSFISPEHFFNALKDSKPHIGFVDLNINKEKNAGLYIVKTIRKILGDNLPVFVISRYKDQEIINEAIRLGASDYITKPVDDAYLKSKILHYVDEREAGVTNLRDLPFFEVPEKYSLGSLKLECDLHEITETGITIISPYYASPDTYISLQHNILNQITQTIGPLYFKVKYSDSISHNMYKTELEFDELSPELSEKIKEWIIDKTVRK